MAPKRPPTGYDFSSFEQRIAWINERKGLNLDAKKRWWDEDLQGIIENPIGYVKMPVALCGPLEIQGDYAKGEFLIPFCTVEGTLSISLTRGAYFANMAGGIQTHYLKQEMSRSPVFFLPAISDLKTFFGWLQVNFPKIKEVAESTTRFGKLLRIDPYPMGRKVILDFVFSTGDAAGQNMVTFATQQACRYIQESLEDICPLHYFIESNFSGDKKACYRNMIQGRGHAVTASLRIPEKMARRVLRMDPLKLAQGSLAGALGSALSGQVGHNLHTANALAGLYLATGQDVACVAENAGSIFHSEILADGSYECSMTLPSITIGTVGGGTRLEDQNANLRLLECEGENGARKFAEIIAATALALEISLGLAVAQGDFADAHERYGRKKQDLDV